MGHGAGDSYPSTTSPGTTSRGRGAFSTRSLPVRFDQAPSPHRGGVGVRGPRRHTTRSRSGTTRRAALRVRLLRALNQNMVCSGASRVRSWRLGQKAANPWASSTCTATSGSGADAITRATSTHRRRQRVGGARVRDRVMRRLLARSRVCLPLGEPRSRVGRLSAGRRRIPPRDERPSGAPTPAPPPFGSVGGSAARTGCSQEVHRGRQRGPAREASDPRALG